MTRARMTGGFTLVEILIVVVILGILAAIVIPQFTNATGDAKASNLGTQLQSIRGQLEVYRLDHKGNYPDLSANWNQLTRFSDIDGNTNATKTSTFCYGPYVLHAPVNPLTNSTLVGASSASTGWVYNSSTGVIKACAGAALAVTLKLDTANDVVTY